MAYPGHPGPSPEPLPGPSPRPPGPGSYRPPGTVPDGHPQGPLGMPSRDRGSQGSHPGNPDPGSPIPPPGPIPDPVREGPGPLGMGSGTPSWRRNFRPGSRSIRGRKFTPREPPEPLPGTPPGRVRNPSPEGPEPPSRRVVPGPVRSPNRPRKKVEKSALPGCPDPPDFPMSRGRKHWSHFAPKKTLI